MIQSASLLKDEIASFLKEVRRDEEGIIRAGISFPPAFSGFKGHFPGRPVVPGVCKIMLVCVLLEAVLRRPVSLKRILKAKFLAPVSCDTELTVCVSSAGTGTVKAVVATGTVRVAELHLEVSYG
ncbi:MAG: hypothetical protein MJA29_07045 [Candidatus Omnitrophica bacterium]|nr:hypothetical protein [Candidatus Omnitrophota bacterium]